MSASPRSPLTRVGIVRHAIAIADADGLDALGMRPLARRLGYEVMSLYNHIRNKDELLALMLDAVAAEVDPADPADLPLAGVRRIAVELRHALGRHPWAAGLWLRHRPGPERTRLMDDLLRLFDDSELAPDLAHHGFHAVSNHVLGYTLQELDIRRGPADGKTSAESYLAEIDTGDYPHMAAHVRQHLSGTTSSSFELVLDLILDGLRRLDAER